MHATGFRLGIDFGTSHTVAVLRWPDGRAKPLLFDGSPLLPSAVYAEPSGGLVVGRDAVHSARLDPARFEPNPKRRVDDGWVLLGDREVEVVELVGAVLARAADEARRTAGGIPGTVTLSCPAAWGTARRRLLGAAAARAGLGEVSLVEEPVAAATYFARVLGHRMAMGSAVVVYDFGGGTFDVSVVERTGDGFRTLAVDGRDDVGGVDLDDALVRSVGALCGAQDPAAWQRLAAPSTAEERRQRRLLWDDVRGVKERLSRHSSSALYVPGLGREMHVTREEFEALAQPLLAETVRLTAQVMRRAGTPRERVAGVFLVGGSSRIPLVNSMVHRGLEIPPTVIEQPELVVAEGSVLSEVTPGGPTLVATAPPPVSAPPVSAPPVSAPPVAAPPVTAEWATAQAGVTSSRWPVSTPPAPTSPGPAQSSPAAAPVSPPVFPRPSTSPPAPISPPARTAPSDPPRQRSAPASGHPAVYGAPTRPPARRGRALLYATLAVLLAGALAVAAIRFWPEGGDGGNGGSGDRPSDARPDLLYGGTQSGQKVILAARDGTITTLPAGGAVKSVVGVPGGWVVVRTNPGGDDSGQFVDPTGKVRNQHDRIDGMFVNLTGTRAAVHGKDGLVRIWDLTRGGDAIAETSMGADIRVIGWVGDLILVRKRSGEPLYTVHDYWNPARGYVPEFRGGKLLALGGRPDGTLVAMKEGAVAPCLIVVDVPDSFQVKEEPPCGTPVRLAKDGIDDVLPLVSPDGATLLARNASGEPTAFALDKLIAGDTGGAALTSLGGGSIKRVSWASGVVFVQTADRYLRCRIGTGNCDTHQPDPQDGLTPTRLVVRFPA